MKTGILKILPKRLLVLSIFISFFCFDFLLIVLVFLFFDCPEPEDFREGMDVDLAVEEVVLTMPFRPPFLLDLPGSRDALDDKFSVDLLDVVTIWISINFKAFDKTRSPLEYLSTKDARVNMEEAEFVSPGLIRPGKRIDRFN